MPKDFQKGSSKYVFVKITKAVHKLTFLAERKVEVDSTITFTAENEGKPVFDLALDRCLNASSNEAVPMISVGGKKKTLKQVKPPQTDEWYSAARNKINPGGGLTATISYRLDLADLESRPEDDAGAMSVPATDKFDCFLEFSDALSPNDGRRGKLRKFQKRGFLSRYLVSNPEFDQYEMEFEIVLESGHEHTIYASGHAPLKTALVDGLHVATLTFSDKYTESSPFLFITPGDYYSAQREFDLLGEQDKGEIHVFSKLSQAVADDAADRAQMVLNGLLQTCFGKYPHEVVNLFVTSYDAMEYAGAFTVTMNYDGGYQSTSDTILHELVHGYFGRCMLPETGAAGWFDEAVSVWFARGMPVRDTPPDEFTDVAAHPDYVRYTDDKSYTVGTMLLAHMAHLRGGAQQFCADLAGIFQEYEWKTITAEKIQDELVALDAAFEPLMAHVNTEPEDELMSTKSGSTEAFQKLVNSLLDNVDRTTQIAFFKDPETVMDDAEVDLPEERAVLFTMDRRRIATWVANSSLYPDLAHKVRTHHFKSAWPYLGPEATNFPAPPPPDLPPGMILSFLSAGAGGGGWTDPHPHGRGIHPAVIASGTSTEIRVYGEGFLRGCTVHIWPVDSVGDPSEKIVVPPASIELASENFRRRTLRFDVDLPAGTYVVTVSNDPSTLEFETEVPAGQVLLVQ